MSDENRLMRQSVGSRGYKLTMKAAKKRSKKQRKRKKKAYQHVVSVRHRMMMRMATKQKTKVMEMPRALAHLSTPAASGGFRKRAGRDWVGHPVLTILQTTTPKPAPITMQPQAAPINDQGIDAAQTAHKWLNVDLLGLLPVLMTKGI
jgi:hypothetical protein